MVLPWLPSAFAASKSFVVVEEGRPKATIVTAAKPSENAAAAARELQRYLRKMSGAELQIVTDEQETTGAMILVGASRFTEKLADLKIPSELTPQFLADMLAGYDRERLLAMAILARSVARTDATERVADACMELARSR